MAWWCDGKGVGLMILRSRVQLPAVSLSSNDFRKIIHTCLTMSPSSIIWYWPKGGDGLWLVASNGSLPLGL